MKIVLLEAEFPSTLSILQFYSKLKEVKIVCVTSSKLPILFFSKFKKNGKILRYPEPKYISFISQVEKKKRIKLFQKVICQVVKENKIDYIFSQSENTLIPLLLIRKRLKEKLPYPSLKAINTLHDKPKLYKYFLNIYI